MGINKGLVGVKGDECDCGRRWSIRHCIACGSPRIYARMNRAHKMLMSGELKYVETQFRCQSCGHLFIEDERQYCDAPPVGPKLAAQKVRALAEAAETGEYLSPNDKRASEAIRELLSPQQSGTDKSQKEKYDEFLRKEFQIRHLFADEKFKALEAGKKMTETVDQFIERHLKELKIERVYPPAEPKEDEQSEKSEQSNQQGE